MPKKRKDPKSNVCGKGRFWTQEENNYLLAHPGADEVERVARHLGRSVISIKSRRSYLGLSHKFGGNSFRPLEHKGPEGWTVEQGPPCLLCILHDHKIEDIKGKNFSRKCRSCEASTAWARYNAGGPAQSGDYCEPWPTEPETEEVSFWS